MPDTTGEGSRAGRTLWLLPIATFVVGVALGAVGTGVGVDGGLDGAVGPAAGQPAGEPTVDPTPGAATPAPTSVPGASPDPDVAVAVPRSCLQVADEARQLAGLVRDAAEAAGQLDAARLSGIVRGLEESQGALDALSGECRTGADPVP